MEKLYLKRSWRIGSLESLLTSLVIRFQVLMLRWLEIKI